MRRPKRPKHSKTRKDAVKAGFRSGFEMSVASNLTQEGVEYEYENKRIKYTVDRTYTPDFELPNGIILEAKGRFTGADRSKHLKVRAQHPELDIRFVFQVDNEYGTVGKRYSDWCEQHGFQYCIVNIPGEWLYE